MTFELVPEMGSSFQDAFWGQNDQGLEVLLTRLREGRASLKFIQSIVSAKADLQEFYGKKLVKLCKDAPNELPYIVLNIVEWPGLLKLFFQN